MIGWAVLAVYVIGFPFAWRSFALSLIDGNRRDFPELWKSESERRSFRGTGAAFGLILAFAWPLMIPIRAGWRMASRSDLLLTDHERAERAEAEVKRLRDLARANGLPYPKVPE